MNFLETHKLAITTLSPIHIGCGEDYEPTNYVIDGKQLYTFDPVRLLRELPPQNREEFARIVEGKDSLRAIQRFFYRHKKTAGKIGRLSANVVDAAQTFYDSRIGQVAQREQGGKDVLNKLEIARTAFNPLTGQPILPGSSLKGAIRTAMLDALLVQFRGGIGTSLKGAIRTAMLERLIGNKRYLVNTKDREGNLLKEGVIKKEASRQNQRMAQEVLQLSSDPKLRFSTDPFRFLKIGDAAFRPEIKKTDGTVAQRRPCILFQVNRKKRPNKHEASGNINTMVECIPGSTPQAFSAQWSAEQKTQFDGRMPKKQLDFAQIAEACNKFYFARFQAEAEILKKEKYATKWVEGVEKMLGSGGCLKKWMDTNDGFLLRVGRHSGAESVTVDAPRSIKIMKGKGQTPQYESETTTLWLAADRKDQIDNLQPFGWVFVKKLA